MRSVAARAYLGLAGTLIGLALAVFLPANTVEFWQAWVFLLAFLGWTLIFTVYFLKHSPELIERRLKAGPIAERERSQKVIQTFTAVLFVGIFVLAGLDRRFSWSRAPAVLVILGDAFVVAGLFITFFVAKENRFASSVIEVNEGQQVISTGPYRLVRHPMYSGSLLMLLFTPLALGSYWALVLFPAMAAAIAWRLIEEEKFLVEHLAGYEEYRRRVHYRLVPGVW